MEDTDVDVAQTLKEALTSFGNLFSAEKFSDALKSDHQRMQDAWSGRNEKFERDIANSIDVDETHWLVERIGRDKVLHENEKALLRFLKQESSLIHPSLHPLLDKVS